MWGKAKPDWYASNFSDMSLLARRAVSQGICFFDPRESKRDRLEKLKKLPGLDLIEEFDDFDPSRLDPFMAALRAERP